MSDLLHCYGALALECAAPPKQPALTREAATELADHMANDLARLLPGVERLDLSIAAATFDPAELLRPGWPLHATLSELTRRAPKTIEPRVLGFATFEGAMPPGLQPEPHLRGGPLQLVPFALQGDADVALPVGRAMEETLLETGMADAATSLFAQTAFGAPLEHARYLSLHDLCAMTAMQYQHAGIGPLWPLVETALFTPEKEHWLNAPPEPLARYANGEIRIAQWRFDGWNEAGFAPPATPPEKLARAFDHFQSRQRQFAALLGAHGISVRLIECGVGEDARQRLNDRMDSPRVPNDLDAPAEYRRSHLIDDPEAH